MTLYELTEKMRGFELNIDDETGEILNADELDRLEMERNEKIENVCLYIKNLKSEADAIANEASVLRARKNRAERKIEWLRGYVQDNLHGEKFSTPKVDITYCKSQVVVCDDPEKLDARFQRVKIEADKSEIKKALKGGESVAGAHLEDTVSMIMK